MYAHRGSIQSVVVLFTLLFCTWSGGLTNTHAAMANTMPPTSATRPTMQSVDRPLLGRTVLIDPGHGGKDPGAGRAGVEEKNITLAVSLLLRDRLQALGAKVDLTRAVDEAVPLTVRLTDSNTICPDLFLSVHVNSVRDSHINGIETYYYDGRGQLLARNILDTLAHELHQPAKWSHVRDLKVLVGNRAPATLAEIGYLTNPTGRAELRDPHYQDKVAGALADSLVGYFATPGSALGCLA